jgi:predicted CopG family antitoxin
MSSPCRTTTIRVSGNRWAIVGITPPINRFDKMIAVLSDKPVSDVDVDRLNVLITEVQLRYLVLAKTLDQTIPPTPIKHAVRSLKNRVSVAMQALADPDRDKIVQQMMGLPDNAPIPASRPAFEGAQSIAERAAIAHAMIAQFATDISDLEKFFDYKSDLTPRGNQTKFAITYAVNALADVFENENALDRKASINMGIRLNDEDDQGDFLRYTGVFLRFMTEFFRRVDDSEMATSGSNSFADRLRRLTANRRKDPELFRLLHGDVQVETLLEFMRRAEEAR